MLFFKANIAGTETLAFKLDEPLRDWSVPTQGFPGGLWGFFRGEFGQEVEDAFSAQGGASGPWAPLSTTPPPKGGNAATKARKFGGSQILQATGGLLGSFFGGAGFRYESRPMSMTWGSDNPLAGYHQRGHAAAGGHTTRLPQRKIWDPDAGFFGRLRSGAVRYMNARYRRQGFRLMGDASENPLRIISRAEASAAGRAWFTGGA